MLALYLLGSPRCELDGEPLRIGRRKVLALLAYLAVTARPQVREALTELLYPRQNRSRARSGFRQTLSLLKSVIGGERLGSDGNSLGLCPAGDLWVDVHEFRRLLRRCREEQRPPSDPDSENPLRQAAELYRGEFLSGFYLKDSPTFEEWQFFEQENLQGEYAAVLERLVDIHSQRGEQETAIGYARSWLSLDPLAEEVHRLLMRLCYLAGQPAAALRQYEQCRLLLHRELAETPAEETERLHQEIVQRRMPVPAARTRTGRPNNLRRPLTSFVGRERELAEVLDSLQETKARLLTLTGPAGTGKTRLAVQAALKLVDSFEHGVFFVDLAASRDPARFGAEVAAVLAVRETRGDTRPPLEILKAYLAAKQMLLLLDNFEHLLPAAPQVRALLAAAPRLKLLVTSREPLHLQEERLLEVPPLGLPVGRQPAGQLGGCEAVRLFIDRGAAVKPDFAFSEVNATAVAEICTRLDGLPLAIELAASRLTILSAQDLLKRLVDGLGILKGGPRDLPARQQTLRATIDWSYELLQPEEKSLFVRLAVFISSCALEAVEQVCGDGPDEVAEGVLDGLASLVDKHLLRRYEEKGETRFWMLETIRAYARRRFKAEAEAEAIRERHARYFLRLAEEAEPLLHGSQQMDWLDRLERESSNLQSALSWLLADGRVAESLRLAVALVWFWYRYGHFSDGAEWLRRALDQPRAARHPTLRARALHALGWMLFIRGDWSGARRLYRQSLELLRELADRRGQCIALSDLGVVERWLGEQLAGNKSSKKALAIARELADPLRTSLCLLWAYATTGGKFTGRPPQAELEEALSLSRRLGNIWGIAVALNGLGDMFRELGDYKAARPRYEEALRAFRELKDGWMIAWTLEGLGTSALLNGDVESARRHLREGLRIFSDLGDRGNVALLLGRLGMAARAAGEHDRAACLLAAYRSLQDSLVGPDAVRALEHTPDLAAAFAEYQANHPQEWSRGQVMDLEQAVQYALEGAAAGS